MVVHYMVAQPLDVCGGGLRKRRLDLDERARLGSCDHTGSQHAFDKCRMVLGSFTVCGDGSGLRLCIRRRSYMDAHFQRCNRRCMERHYMGS